MIKKIIYFFTLATAIFLVTLPAWAFTTSSEETANIPALMVEPSIRVGIMTVKQPVKFVASGNYVVFAGDELQGDLNAGQTTTLSYKLGKYYFKSAKLNFSSKDFLFLTPSDSSGIFTLNITRKLSAKSKINYNVYRGALEFRYSPKNKLPYIINELPLEQYLLGVAEAYDNGPIEFIKAITVAARTYAFTNISGKPVSDKNLFDVYASTKDQLYLGYNGEKDRPMMSEAVKITAGEMVTYNNAPVITLYFSHSNGLTKSWVGKGVNSRPWLTAVEAPFDGKQYKKFLGHGYGMSLHDAEARALELGWNYGGLLTYYYTDTKVVKMY